MLQAFWQSGQPLGPDEIIMINRIVADFRRERKLEADSEEALRAAAELLKWFRTGVTQSGKLRELLYSLTPPQPPTK
ncbi:acetyltransferase [Rhizobium sp. NPDC090275]|uniref:acetyltransferase n=1 Tax=Rhizobium sp. NPDC090275 TaxID=3364498 RepID=UPI00383BA70B